MAKRIPRSNKRKSADRWQSGWKVHDDVLPSLDSPGQAAVFWACWFRAEFTESGDLVFDVTSTQLASLTGMSPRTVERHLQELTAGDVFQVSRNGCNKGGRSLGAERRITFRPYRKPTQQSVGIGTESPNGNLRSFDRKPTQNRQETYAGERTSQ